jgi:hypothetical protein
MTLNQQHQRGVEAAQVLENEAYKQAMASLRAEIVNQWKACPVRDKEGQLLLLQLAKLSDKFEGILSGLIESGKFAKRKLIEDELRNENAAKKLVRRVF